MLYHQPGKQSPVAFKNLFQGIEQQAFTKTPWARQKNVFIPLNQLQRQSGFIDIVITAQNNFRQVLNADR